MALVDFLTAIQTRIATLASREYYGETVDPNAQLPYVTWKYATTNDIEDLEDFIIEVDVWDSASDATAIEGMVAAIDGDGARTNPSGLHYYHYGSGARPTFRMFRINRLALPTLDENLLRRQLRYRVRVYL